MPNSWRISSHVTVAQTPGYGPGLAATKTILVESTLSVGRTAKSIKSGNNAPSRATIANAHPPPLLIAQGLIRQATAMKHSPRELSIAIAPKRPLTGNTGYL